MELSTEFWLQVGIYLISFAFFGGVTWQKLKYLEEKQDKLNKLIERMYNAEENINAAHDRIDRIEEKEGSDK